MGLLLGGIAVGCLLVLWPFFSAILWAASSPTRPGRSTNGCARAAGSAGAARPRCHGGAVAFVVVVLPIALAVPGGADDVDHLRTVVQGALAGRAARRARLAARCAGDRPDAGRALEFLGRRPRGDGRVLQAVFRHGRGVRPVAAARAGQRRADVPAGAVRGVLLLRLGRPAGGRGSTSSSAGSPAPARRG